MTSNYNISAQQRKTTNKTKRQSTERETIFVNDIFDKELMFKICKEVIQLYNKKINTPVKIWAEDTDTSPEGTYR